MTTRKLLVSLALFLVCCLFIAPNYAQAATSVVLTVDPFSDPDAEDTHSATQWVVRDSDSTAYDSGTDVTNLTSITIAGTFFVSGTTYFWKARFRDQHMYWSAYSDEVSFVYTDGSATPTPTPTPTPVPTSTPSSTTTATLTTTPTPTTTTTSTGTPMPEVTTTATTTVSASATITVIKTITVSPGPSTTALPWESRTPILYGTSATPRWGDSSTPGPLFRQKYTPGVDLIAGVDPVYPKIIFASASLVAATMETFAGLLFGSRFISSMSAFFSKFFRLIPWRRRKTKWGYVYDSISKNPIPGAQIRIYSEPDGRSRQVQYSQDDGSFGFVVPNGLYSLTGSKEFYSFPSTIAHGKNDGLYENLYFGEQLEIGINKKQNETDEFKLSIPLDRTKKNVAELVGADLMMRIRNFFDLIRMPILIIGTVLTIFLVIRFDYIYDLFLLALYVAIWFYEIYSRLMPRTFGKVVDELGRGLSSAVVRVMNASGRIVSTTITGEDGHFRASLEKGTFIFEATKIGYSRSRTGLLTYHKPGDLSKVDLKLSKISRQKKKY